MRGSIPTISVIIPAYNHAAWMEQALDSVLQQTLKDWELIVIDDASHDQSWSVLTSWAAEHPGYPLRLVQHQHNQGAPATLNQALSLAQGEYIAILNSDDAWHPQRLERLLVRARAADLDVVLSGVALWDSESLDKAAREPHWMEWYQALQANWCATHDVLHTLLRGNFAITTSNFFFHRRVYTQLGHFAELRYVHDYEYLLRGCAAGLRMEWLWDEVLLYYRLHEHNTIREKPLAAIEENQGMLLAQLPVLQQQLTAERWQSVLAQLQQLQVYIRAEWLTLQHQRLLEQEQSLLPLIQDRDQWIAERDQIIAQQQQALVERDVWVGDRDRWIAERDGVIAQQGQAMSALGQALAQRDQWVADRDRWMLDRDIWIAERDQLIAQQQHWLNERDHWIKERDQLISRLHQEQDSLLQSRSYRLGESLLKPLRHLRACFSREKWRARHA